MDSASYRFSVCAITIFASVAVAHCPRRLTMTDRAPVFGDVPNGAATEADLAKYTDWLEFSAYRNR